MANVKVIIVNPTGVELANVNGGGADVPPYSVSPVLTLSDAEVAAIGAAGATTYLGTTVIYCDPSTGAQPSDETKRLASKILRLGKNPGTATS